ncbi:class I SAM-dependent methyltransferase [Actinoallomurus sp. NBC_01490]|uniref:class I SAM-dependent methyltransferase n=1 Tax=Actinoallomurus sp. NBC_01490 TaxID=2903557 RepID=UPI002E3284FE|nr:methyltransferase domain-containing protein [Actinoallomurus sp. NBC_01490]
MHPRGAAVLSIPAKHPAVGESESLASYWTFYWAVAAAQLSRWLPRRPSRVLDLSGPQSRYADQAAHAGHTVVEVRDAPRGAPQPRHTHTIVAEASSLGFLSPGSFDAVVAEGRMLSRHLVTENVVAEIARVLRPGGRVLLSVDSLVLGMAILAEQNYWAHLSDVPRSEVVLVPWPDGTITRCFGVEQLRDLLTECGLEVEWIRPRTALSPSTVEHVLNASPQSLTRLVRAELTAPQAEEPVGIHLVASAIKKTG